MRQITSTATQSLSVIGVAVLLSAGLIGGTGVLCPSLSTAQTISTEAVSHTTAQSYRYQAEHARAKAEMYERKAASLGQYADTKGFVRNSLKMAAQTHRAKASNLEQLASLHENQSDLARK